MKILTVLLILIFIVPLNAQWPSFDLQNIDKENFKNDVDPFIKSISHSMINHFDNPSNTNNQLLLGVAYSYGINISNNTASIDLISGYPNFGGSLLISENLTLKGNFSIFNSGEDVVQSISYGLGLNLTNKEENNWKASILFSQLQGPDDIRIKSVDGNLIYDFSLKEIPIFAGFGVNSYKARILIEEEEIPSSIKGSANYLLLGLHYTYNRFIVTPLLQINSDILEISVELSGVVR